MLQKQYNHMNVLKVEIEYLKTQIQPHDTGHIHTTISTLKHRVSKIEEDILHEELKAISNG